MKIKGFIVEEDAIVPCHCGAKEGQPCKPSAKEKDKWIYGYSHIGRRVRRLLLTAKDPTKREAFEKAALIRC